MLIELHIKDYAVLEDVTLSLGPGLTALTGETGAGKSIIVDALSLLMGDRASSDVVRAGASRAMIEAVFDVGRYPHILERLDQLGVEMEDRLLVLKREVQSEGRNRAWINASPSTAAVVGELGSALVDIHGQHEHQSLLRRDEQRVILDGFAGASALADRVRDYHAELTRLRREVDEREERVAELQKQADFLRFQLEEIVAAKLRPGEDEELEAEARRLEHIQEVADGAQRIHDELYEADGSVTDRLAELKDVLKRLAHYDPALEEFVGMLEAAYHQVGEVGGSIGDYAGGLEPDPAALAEVRERQDLLFRMKRKYGPELDDVLATRDRVRREIEELESSTHDVEDLKHRLGEAREKERDAASQLSRARGDASLKLAERMAQVLPQLGMEGGRFEVRLVRQEEPGPGGAENVEFRVSTNAGFDPQPLARIASGGELSRVMLALKSILAGVDQVPTLVFDEIDAGIGGVVATGVAAKLHEVASTHQVFVVTHRPQVAARAHAHLRVDKEDVDGLAVATVTLLDKDARVIEVARMLGGDPESRKSQAHADEILEEAPAPLTPPRVDGTDESAPSS